LASIELSQLESHLWEAANILRGPVDAADFTTYVFPQLFFKRKVWAGVSVATRGSWQHNNAFRTKTCETNSLPNGRFSNASGRLNRLSLFSVPIAGNIVANLAATHCPILSYFHLSQIKVRTVFLPVAGSVEGSVVSVKWLPSNL
jgi:hypothetical protein